MNSHIIFGGSGFIGQHVARAFVRLGDDVTIVSSAENPVKFDTMRSINVDLHQLAPTQYDRLLRNADIIHHYAWSTIPAKAHMDPILDICVNTSVTIKILEALRRRGGGRIIFASSGGTVYGRVNYSPAAESHPTNPVSAYGVGKITSEKYLEMYRIVYGVDARIARISNPYGPGQNPFRQQGVIATFIESAINNRTVQIWGTGEARRDFIFIEDVASALVRLAIRTFSFTGLEPIFNIGSGTGATVNEVLDVIRKITSTSVPVDYLPGRSFDLPYNVLDISRALQYLDWRPEVKLTEGIQMTFNSIKGDHIKRSF